MSDSANPAEPCNLFNNHLYGGVMVMKVEGNNAMCVISHSVLAERAVLFEHFSGSEAVNLSSNGYLMHVGSVMVNISMCSNTLRAGDKMSPFFLAEHLFW